MKRTLTTGQAAEAIRGNGATFSYRGSYALAGYLEELEDTTGVEMELDAVAIRCEWSEYESAAAYAVDHLGEAEALERFGDETGQICDEYVMEWLLAETSDVIEVDAYMSPNPFFPTGKAGRIIVLNF